MDDRPHDYTPVPRFTTENQPEPHTDGFHGLTIPDLETDLTLSRRRANTPFGPGLLPQAPSTWSAHDHFLMANMDEDIGSHGISAHMHGLALLHGSLGIPEADRGWDTVNAEPGSFFLADSNNFGQIVDGSHGISCSGIFHNNLGTVNPHAGMLDKGPAMSNSAHPLGSSGSTGGSLGPGILDPGLTMTTFHENHHWLDNLQSDLQCISARAYPTHSSVNADSIWDICEVPSAWDLHLDEGSSHLAGVVHDAGCGFTGMENAITVPLHSDQYAMFSSPNWFAENAGGASIPVTQRETVARWQCDNVDDSAVVLVTNTSPVSHVPSVGKPDDGNARHRVVRKRIRHSASEWKEMDSHLRRLYLIHGHTAEEVAFEMFAIHDFEASVGTYQKRLACLGKDKRLRTARALPDDPSLDTKTETPKLFEIVAERVRRTRAEEQRSERNRRKEERNRRRQLQVERGNKKGRKKRKAKPSAGISQGAIGPFLHTIYIHQEELFHAIDAFCKVLFAAGNKSWAADARHFRPPPNTPDSSRAWQLLSDQVAGVQMLVEGQLYHHANYMLRQVLAGLRLAARVPDPSFLLHFWTMCDVFSNIPIRTKGKGQALPWLGWFLRHLKQILASEFGRRPLTVIVDSLLRVWASSPRDLKATLGLGHWKATHTMGDLIGNTHNIVLNMGICCSKTWKSKFSASSTTVKLLHRPLLVAVESPNHEPEHLAEASLNYLRAVTRDPCNEPEVISEASRLLSWTTDMCREKARRQALQYDSVTRAFVAATELVARHYLETRIPRPDPECGYRYMGEAVEILRCGDLQCRIRAASFSKRLQTWIKGHRRKKGERSKREAMEEEKMRVAQERVRTREIIRDITKERIKGSRRGKWVRRARVKRALKEGRPLEKNLLLASLEQTS